MKKTIVVFSFYNPGRINPLVAIIEELVKKENCEVICYGDVSTQKAIEASGATFKNWYTSLKEAMKSFPYPDDYFQYYRKTQGIPNLPPYLWRLEEALLYLDDLMSEVMELKPDLIFHDPACIEAVTISEVCNIKRISHITTSGKGVWGDKRFSKFSGTSWQAVITSDSAIDLRNTYKEKYGFDPFHQGLPWQFYSKELNIVSLIPQLCIELNRKDDPFVYLNNGPSKPQVFVGPCISKRCRVNGNYTIPKSKQKDSLEQIEESKEEDVAAQKELLEMSTKDFPLDELKYAKESGKKIVYFSLGTVIPAMLWNGAPEMKIGGAPSGKAFTQRMCKNLIKALGNEEDLMVLMNVGMKTDALDFLTSVSELPSNFIVRQKSPQVQALEIADVFVTHGGAGSVNEACLSATPTVILPGFGDQLSNGRTLVDAGAGMMYWSEDKAYIEATPDKLRKAVLACLESNSFQKNAAVLGKECLESGGQKQAAEILFNELHKTTV